MLGTLSVRENLQFSAALRLPGHMTKAQREERVERVIETLGLYRCADTKVSRVKNNHHKCTCRTHKHNIIVHFGQGLTDTEDFSISQCSLNKNIWYSACVAGILKLVVAIFSLHCNTFYVATRATGNDVTRN